MKTGSIKSAALDAAVRGRRSIALAASLVSAAVCQTALGARAVKVDKVVAGSASFTTVGSKEIIRTTDRTIIDFKQFNVMPGETVQFLQPSSHSRVLDRIEGSTPSQIDGNITSNGIVYFIDNAGVVFGPHSVVTANQVFTAGGGMTNADFTAGMNKFELTSSIVNNGVINATAIALAGVSVINSGSVTANGGIVTFAVGNDVYIGPRNDTMTVKVTATDAPSTTAANAGSIQNSGTVSAPSGAVSMVAGDVFSIALGNAGRVSAPKINIDGGKSGNTQVSGSLNAASNKAVGGNITVTGKNITLKGATVDASGTAGGGAIRIGGDFHGKGKIATAETTTVDSASTINASATTVGPGGTVAIWSDTATAVHGTVSAAGTGGIGGFIETSGERTLDVSGISIIARGTHAGTWLMDPGNVTIDSTTISSGGTLPTGGLFVQPKSTDTPNDSVINSSDIQAAFAAGANVVIKTGYSDQAGLGTGFIIANPGSLSNLTIAANTKAILTLSAGGFIDIESDINTVSPGNLTVNLSAGDYIKVNSKINTDNANFSAIAGTGVAGTGGASFTGASIITTGGGTFNVTSQGTAAGVLGGGVTLAGKVSTVNASGPGGAVILGSTTGVDVSGSVLTSGGQFTVNGTTATFQIDNSGSVDTSGNGGGPVNITTIGSTTIAGALNAGAAAVNITSTGNGKDDLNSISTFGTGTIASTNLTGGISLSTTGLSGTNAVSLTIDAGSITATVTPGGKTILTATNNVLTVSNSLGTCTDFELTAGSTGSTPVAGSISGVNIVVGTPTNTTTSTVDLTSIGGNITDPQITVDGKSSAGGTIGVVTLAASSGTISNLNLMSNLGSLKPSDGAIYLTTVGDYQDSTAHLAGNVVHSLLVDATDIGNGPGFQDDGLIGIVKGGVLYIGGTFTAAGPLTFGTSKGNIILDSTTVLGGTGTLPVPIGPVIDNGSLTIQSAGSITIATPPGSPVTIGSTNSLTLRAASGISESAGNAIYGPAGTLLLSGTGPFSFAGSNTVGTLGTADVGGVAGSVYFVNVALPTGGTVPLSIATTGLITSGAGSSVTLISPGINVTGPISAGLNTATPSVATAPVSLISNSGQALNISSTVTGSTIALNADAMTITAPVIATENTSPSNPAITITPNNTITVTDVDLNDGYTPPSGSVLSLSQASLQNLETTETVSISSPGSFHIGSLGGISLVTNPTDSSALSASLLLQAGTGNIQFNLPPSSGVALPSSLTTVGTQTYNGPVVLNANTILTSGSGSPMIFNSVQFNGLVDGAASGAQTLEVKGSAGFAAAVGSIAPLEQLTVDGKVNFAAPSLFYPDSVQTVGSQTYSGAATLSANTTLFATASNATVQFNSTIDSATSATPESLTIQSPQTGFGNGAGNSLIGNKNPLASLTVGNTADVKGTITFNIVESSSSPVSIDLTNKTPDTSPASVVTTGPQIYTGAVTLEADTVLQTTGNSALASTRIAFASTVTSAAVQKLEVVTAAGGIQLFQSTVSVGGLKTCGTTSATAGYAEFDGTVNLGGTAALGDAVLMVKNDLTINDSATAGEVHFYGNIETVGTQAYSLTINNNLNVPAYFGGSVGDGSLTGASGAGIGGLTVTGATTFAFTGSALTPSVQTQVFGIADANARATQLYEGAVKLSAPTFLSAVGGTSGTITFDSKSTATSPLGMTNATPQVLDVLEAVSTTFDGPVGTASNPLAQVFIQVGPTFINGAAVDTVQNATLIDQHYVAAVTLGDPTPSITKLSGTEIEFDSTLDALGTTPGQSLSVSLGNNGSLWFKAPVGMASPNNLNNVYVAPTTGATTTLGAPVAGVINPFTLRTVNGSYFGTPVTLDADTIVQSTGTGGYIGFGGPITTSSAGSLWSLTISNGSYTGSGNSVAIAANIGSSTSPLGAITVSGGTGSTLLGQATDPVTGTAVTSTALSLFTKAGIDGSGFLESATQTFNSNVVLAANITTTATALAVTAPMNANILFTGSIISNGTPQALTVLADGATLFGGSVGGAGGSTELSSLTVGPYPSALATDIAPIIIAGASILTGGSAQTGSQTYNGPVVLANPVLAGVDANSINTNGYNVHLIASGDVFFSSTIDGNYDSSDTHRTFVNPQIQSLEITLGGADTITGYIGGISPLGYLLIDGTSGGGSGGSLKSIAIDNGGIHTIGDQVYDLPVTLGNPNAAVVGGFNTILTSDKGAITFGSTLDALQILNVPQSLQVTAGGGTFFDGGVGSTGGLPTSALYALTVVGPSTFNIPSVNSLPVTVDLTTGTPTQTSGQIIASVRTDGTQTYLGPVSIQADTLLLTTGNFNPPTTDITFTSLVTAATNGSARLSNLEVDNAGAGIQHFEAALSLGGVKTTSASGYAEFQSATATPAQHNVTLTNTAAFGDPVLIASGDLEITQTVAANTNPAPQVHFYGEVESGAGGAWSLDVNNPSVGMAVFDNPVGSNIMGIVSNPAGLGGLYVAGKTSFDFQSSESTYSSVRTDSASATNALMAAGSQQYVGAVTVNADTLFSATDGGHDAANTIHFYSNILNGDSQPARFVVTDAQSTTFDQAVGASGAGNEFGQVWIKNGETFIDGQSVYTVACGRSFPIPFDQDYAGPVLFGAPLSGGTVVTTLLQGQNIRFESTVDSATTANNQQLDLQVSTNGAITFMQNVGVSQTNAYLNGLYIYPASGAVTTLGDPSVTPVFQMLTVNGTFFGTSVKLNNSVNVQANGTGGEIQFAQTVQTNTLVGSAGWGLTVNNAGFTSTTGTAIAFGQSVGTSASPLGSVVLNSGAGVTLLGESTDPLTSAPVVATGTFNISTQPGRDGNGITQTGEQTFLSQVVLADNTFISAIAGINPVSYPNVNFNGTVQTNGTAYSLLVLGDGATTFAKAVGGAATTGTAMKSLTVESSPNVTGQVIIAGPSVLTSQYQSYQDPVLLANPSTAGGFSLTLTANGTDATATDPSFGNSVTFLKTLDAIYASSNSHFTSTGQSLDIFTQGPTVFDGAVGNSSVATSELANLQVDAVGTGNTTAKAEINGLYITTSGVQTFNVPVTLGNPNAATTGNFNTILSASAVTFSKTLDASSTVIIAQSLDVFTTGLTTFQAPVGMQNALANLQVDPLNAGLGGLDLNGGSVKTNAVQNYNVEVWLGNQTPTVPFNTNLFGSAVTFKGLLDANSTVAAGQGLDVFTSGVTTFQAAVGSKTELLNLQVDPYLTGAGGADVNGGAVKTSGYQHYNVAVLLGSPTVTTPFNTEMDAGAVTFLTTLDANPNVSAGQGLDVFTSGLTTFQGKVGSLNELLNLQVEALGASAGGADVNGALVKTTGFQNYKVPVLLGNSTGTVPFNTEIDGSAVTFNMTLDANPTVSAGQGLDVFTSGLTTFQAQVGSKNALLNLQIDPLGSAAGGADINGGLVRTSGYQNYDVEVWLGNPNVTVPFNTVVDASAVTFNKLLDANAAVTAGQGLDVFTSGLTTFQAAVGSQNPLLNLQVDPYLTGAGGADVNGGWVKTTGFQNYDVAVLLGSPAATTPFNTTPFNTTLFGSAITFTRALDTNPAVNQPQNLDVITTGVTTFQAEVGAQNALSNLQVDASGIDINGGLVKTTGDQNYDGAVLLGNLSALTPFNTVMDGSAVTFTLTLDANSTISIGQGLDVLSSGLTTFQAAVGSKNELLNLQVDAYGTGPGGADINGGLVKTSGYQNFNVAVLLGDPTATTPFNTVMEGSTVTFGKTLDANSVVSVGQGLDVSTSGLTTFVGTVGAQTALLNLQVGPLGTANGGADIDGGLVKTTGFQTYNVAVLLGDPTATTPFNTVLDGSAVTFSQALDADKLVTAGQGLDVFSSGLTTFVGAVGLLNPLLNLQVDALGGGAGGADINGGLVKTSGYQNYTVATLLGNPTATTPFNTVIDGSTVTFNQTLDADKTVPTAQGLDLFTSGLTTFTGAVGSLNPLLNLQVDALANAVGGVNVNGGLVKTSGDQNYEVAVLLGNPSASTPFNTVMDGSTVTFNKPLDANNTVTAGQGLDVLTSGLTTLQAPVGSLNPLLNLQIDALGTAAGGVDLNGGLVKTTGYQAYNVAVLLGETAATTTFNTVLDGSAVTFSKTLDSNTAVAGQGLDLFTSGLATFVGAVGSLNPLMNLQVDALGAAAGGADINGGLVKTSGAQTYNVAVLLGDPTATTTFNTVLDGSAVTFSKTLDANTSVTGQGLDIFTSGLMTFVGPVGSLNPLLNLQVDPLGTAPGGVDINGGLVNTSGAQTYDVPVLLGNSAATTTFNTNLDATTVTFNQTLDANTAVPVGQGLDVFTSGLTTFQAAVGSQGQLLNLQIDPAATGVGGADVNGGVVKTTGDQTYNVAVLLGNPAVTVAFNTVMDAADVVFNKTLDANTGTAQGLDVLTSVSTRFEAPVGGGNRLLDLQVDPLTNDAAVTVYIDGAAVTTTATQTYNVPVNLGAPATLTGSTNTFNKTLTGASVISVGTTVFNGNVTVANLIVNGAAAINTPVVTTTTFQAYNGPVTLGTVPGITLTAQGVDANNQSVMFAQTLDGGTPVNPTLDIVAQGTTTFSGTVGASARPASLEVDPYNNSTTAVAEVNGGIVNTTGPQTFNVATTLGAETKLTAPSVTFTRTLDDVTAGSFGLTVAGNASFDGYVGSVTRLNTLTVTGAATLSGGSSFASNLLKTATVATTGSQTFGGTVAITADTVLTAGTPYAETSSSQNVTIGGAVTDTSTGKNSSFEVMGYQLRLNGVTTGGNQTYLATAIGTPEGFVFGGTFQSNGSIALNPAPSTTNAVPAQISGVDLMLTGNTTFATIASAGLPSNVPVPAADVVTYAGINDVTLSVAAIHGGNSDFKVAAGTTFLVPKSATNQIWSGVVLPTGVITIGGDITASTISLGWDSSSTPDAPSVASIVFSRDASLAAAKNAPAAQKDAADWLILDASETVNVYKANVAANPTDVAGLASFFMSTNSRMSVTGWDSGVQIAGSSVYNKNPVGVTAVSLSDISVEGSLFVTVASSGLMTFMNRPHVDDFTNTSGQILVGLTRDDGLDFVGTQDLKFTSTHYAENGAGSPRFEWGNAPDGDYSAFLPGALGLSLPSTSVSKYVATLPRIEEGKLDSSYTQMFTTNLFINGAAITNEITTVAAPAIAPHLKNVAGLSAGQVDELGKMYIRARPVNDIELATGTEGRTIYYQDLEDNVQVASGRIESSEVDELLAAYKRYFTGQGADGKSELATIKIKNALERAWVNRADKEANFHDLKAVRKAFYADNDARAYILGLRGMFTKLQDLGLTTREEFGARSNMVGTILPRTPDLKSDELYDLIMADPQVADSAPAKSTPAPAPSAKPPQVPPKDAPQKSAKSSSVSKNAVASAVSP